MLRISAGLEQDGYTVDWVRDGESADYALQSEHFYRANIEGVAPGCGLGLSIVKRIASLHDATLTLDQPESGCGLRVTVIFPNRTTY